MHYSGLDRKQLATRAHISLSTLDRITGKPQRGADLDDLERIAQACGLPFEWFTADLSRLHEIVPSGMPAIVRSRGAVAAAAREMEAGEGDERLGDDEQQSA